MRAGQNGMKCGNAMFCPTQRTNAFALETSGETLRNDKKGNKRTYEDPGLAVGGGPEEMKEKQKKQSVWVIGRLAWVLSNCYRLKFSRPPEVIFIFLGFIILLHFPQGLQKSIPVRSCPYPTVQGLKNAKTSAKK